MLQQQLMATIIKLSERQSDLLSNERNKHKTSNQLCRRIDIILLSYAGQTNTSIAANLGTIHKTVRDWRNRWASNYSN